MIQRAYGLATDLYQLTMAAAYFDNGMYTEKAAFEMFVRALPKTRSYLIAAGLEQLLDYLQALRFTGDQIDYLRTHPAFQHVSREFFDYLAGLQFTGDVSAIPEGNVAFGMEPLVRVTAPLIEAQLIETYLLSAINFQTMIASKAARLVTAAQGRNIIEFGTRRAHGAEAGLLAARAAYIAGCAGTSNVEAGHLFAIPTFGTLAHSFVMSFDDEEDAFRAFLKVFPDTATVLVDTYDTLAAVEKLTRMKIRIPSIRLDSGDLLSLSIRCRQILDEAGMTDTKILASNDLNEYLIADLIERGARIDAFGVGTQLATSYDKPALGGVYKLVSLEQGGKISLKVKFSPEKATYPGSKQVWRKLSSEGKYTEDVITMDDETAPGEGQGTWRPLLEPVMKDGKVIEEGSVGKIDNEADPFHLRAARFAQIEKARERCKNELSRLPDELLALDTTAKFEVRVNDKLIEERQRLHDKFAMEV